MKILDNIETAMTEEKATEIAEKLNADPEDDWTYKVNSVLFPDDIIRSYVDAYDEEGVFVGTL